MQYCNFNTCSWFSTWLIKQNARVYFTVVIQLHSMQGTGKSSPQLAKNKKPQAMCFPGLNKLRPMATGLATSMFVQRERSWGTSWVQRSVERIMNAFIEQPVPIIAKAEYYQSCHKRVRQNNKWSCSTVWVYDLQPEQNVTVTLSQLKLGE